MSALRVFKGKLKCTITGNTVSCNKLSCKNNYGCYCLSHFIQKNLQFIKEELKNESSNEFIKPKSS